MRSLPERLSQQDLHGGYTTILDELHIHVGEATLSACTSGTEESAVRKICREEIWDQTWFTFRHQHVGTDLLAERQQCIVNLARSASLNPAS